MVKRKKAFKRQILECKGCEGKISKGNQSGMCQDCKFDDTVTITTTRAKKEYNLSDNHFDDLWHFSCGPHSNGKRYLLTHVQRKAKKLGTLNDPKFIAKQEKKKMKKERQEKFSQFIEEQLNDGYVCSFLEEFHQFNKEYLNGNVGDEVLPLIQEYYLKFVEQKREHDKRVTKVNKILSKIPVWEPTKHQHLDSYKVYIGGMHDDIDTLEKEILALYQEEFARKEELAAKLAERGLELRGDSRLCSWYIEGGISMVQYRSDQTDVDDIEDIVDVMEEMNFLFTNTNYSSISRNLFDNSFDREFYCDYGDFISDTRNRAKRLAVERWVKEGGNKEELPKQLKEFVPKVKPKKKKKLKKKKQKQK